MLILKDLLAFTTKTALETCWQLRLSFGSCHLLSLHHGDYEHGNAKTDDLVEEHDGFS